jgi:hypothetical protein
VFAAKKKMKKTKQKIKNKKTSPASNTEKWKRERHTWRQ